jgi:hypothetical protein
MRIIALLSFLAAAPQVIGCSCMAWGPPCQAAWQYEAVVRARVLDIDEPETGASKTGELNWTPRRVKLYVEENLLGAQAAKTTMEVWTGRGGGDCGYPFERGVTYVIYAHRASPEKLIAGTCSRTRPESEASEDLAYFRGLDQRPSSGEIFGVVNSVALAGYGAHTPGPLPGARVVLTGPSGKKDVTAGQDGKYRFQGLAPGKYEIAASAEGYAQPGGMPALELHAKGCQERDLYLGIDRRIRVRIKSAGGAALTGIAPELVPVRPRVEGDFLQPYSGTLREDGSYEFSNVDEGDYYLGVNVLAIGEASSQYPRWLYPGTMDAKAAVPVRVRGAAGVQTFSLTLPEPQEPRVISGQVFSADARPAPGAMVMAPAVYSTYDGMVATQTDNDGRFRITLPQRTAFRLRIWEPHTQQGAETSIPASGDVSNLRLMLQPGRLPDHTTAIREAWEKGSGLP